MGTFVEVAKVKDLPEGAMKQVSAQGREILLARTGDKYYAADNRCPHFLGNLSRGRLEGTVVICPLHGSRFDLRDGSVQSWAPQMPTVLSTVSKILRPPRPLRMHSVKVEGESILVEI